MIFSENIYDFIDVFAIFVYIIIVGIIIYKEHRNKVFDYFAVLTIAAAVSEGLKYVIAKPRPALGVIKGFEGSSFPSTHSTIVFTAFFFFFFACHSLSFDKNRREGSKSTHLNRVEVSENIIVIVLLFLGALFVGVLRIVVGAHYAIDVFAGAVLGFLISVPFRYYDISFSKIK